MFFFSLQGLIRNIDSRRITFHNRRPVATPKPVSSFLCPLGRPSLVGALKHETCHSQSNNPKKLANQHPQHLAFRARIRLGGLPFLITLGLHLEKPIESTLLLRIHHLDQFVRPFAHTLLTANYNQHRKWKPTNRQSPNKSVICRNICME